MDGGAYKTQGADTCVYIPHVTCARKGRKTLRSAPAGTELVSRITRDARELYVQKAVIAALNAIAVKGTGISNFFNLADSACVPEFKAADQRARCTVKELQGSETGLINLVTPKQDETLESSIRNRTKPDALIKTSLRDLMIAMARLNSEYVAHCDTHFGNLGWMGNQLVIFDWGRGTKNRAEFKKWASKYADNWNEHERAYWMGYNQHTVQFSLVEDMIDRKAIKKSGAYTALLSVWDVLGILGPACTHGIVSESRSTAFLKTLFDQIVKNPSMDTTSLVIRLIPSLFADPPAIHPATADRQMPLAEAKILSRIVPNPETATPTPVPAPPSILQAIGLAPPPPPAPAPPSPASPAPVPDSAPPSPASPAPGSAPPPGSPAPAPVEDKKMTDIKNACRALLATSGGTRRRRHRRTRKRIGRKMKGGVLLGAGMGAMVFGLKSNENFLPPPVGSIPPIPPGLGPGDIVAHVTKTEDDVNGKNTLVQRLAAENPYVKMVTTPSIATYDVKTDTFLSTFVQSQENLISGSADAMKLYEIWSSGTQPPLTCSLMLRYNKFSEGDILSLVDLMIGLVHINGRFVHADLNDDNMGIMRDGCPVITDYDRLQTDPMGLSRYIERYIVENTSKFPWFTDIEELYSNMSPASQEQALQFMDQLMKIFDLLTVLYFVDKTNPKLSAITKAFRDWIRQNWKTMNQQQLHKTVSKLGQLIINATTGKEWRPMTMEAEITMAKEYNARPQPARNTPGLWDATRNHYRFGI
jgi:hypothetical protein